MKMVKGSMMAVALAVACAGNAYAGGAIGDCLTANGYPQSVSDGKGGFIPGSATLDLTTTYGAALLAAGTLDGSWTNSQYLSNNSGTCTVKEVQPSSKAKPSVRSVNYGPMNSEECSLIGSTSSIWSKLNQGKFSEAWQINYTMMGKIDTLVSGGKLTSAAGGVIRKQAEEVQACINTLM